MLNFVIITAMQLLKIVWQAAVFDSTSSNRGIKYVIYRDKLDNTYFRVLYSAVSR